MADKHVVFENLRHLEIIFDRSILLAGFEPHLVCLSSWGYEETRVNPRSIVCI